MPRFATSVPCAMPGIVRHRIAVAEVASPIARSARSRLDWVSPQKTFWQVSPDLSAFPQGICAGPPARFRAAPGVALHFRRSSWLPTGDRPKVAGDSVVAAGIGSCSWPPRSFCSCGGGARGRTTPWRVARGRTTPLARVRRWRVPRPGETPSRRNPHPASRSSVPEVAPRPVASRRLLICYLAHYNIVPRYAAVWKLPTRLLGDMTGSGAWSEDRMTKKCGAVVPSGMSGPGLPCSIQAGGTNYLE
jgi:hypothetical protein